MADNFLEYRFEKVFGKNSSVDPETGYAISSKRPSGKSSTLRRKDSPKTDSKKIDTK